MSVLTIVTLWKAGTGKKSAWQIGLANQFLWLGYICFTAQWLLIPMNIALWVVFIRNMKTKPPFVMPHVLSEDELAAFRIAMRHNGYALQGISGNILAQAYYNLVEYCRAKHSGMPVLDWEAKE